MPGLTDVNPAGHFRIFDTALDTIRRAIADVPPERGAALFGSNPLISLVVPDTAGRYSPVSWDISAELGRVVQEVEQAGIGKFIGTVHSHPAGLPVPSGGDITSTMNLLDHNPTLNSVLVAIVTEGEPTEPNHVPVGTHHRISLQLVGRDRGRPVIVPVPGVVVPVGRGIVAAGGDPASGSVTVDQWLTNREREIDRLPSFVDNQALTGFVHQISRGEDGLSRYLAIPVNYPIAAPLLVSESDAGELALQSLGWDPTRRPDLQLEELMGSPSSLSSREEVIEADSPLDRVLSLVGDLRGQHVLIAGLGSVGSRIAEDLVRSGVGEVTLIDPDVVSAPNMARSIYRFADIGRPKVEALVEILKGISPTLVTHSYGSTLGELDLDALLSGVDLVIGATDDMPQQFVLGRAAYLAGIPIVCCALYRGAKAGEVLYSIPALSTPCVACVLGNTTNTASLRPDADYGLSGRLHEEPGLGASIHLVSSMASLLAFGVLGGPDSVAGATVMNALKNDQFLGMISTVPDWDIVARHIGEARFQNAPQSIWLSVERSPQCPTCGSSSASDTLDDAIVVEPGTSIRELFESIDEQDSVSDPS